MLSRLDWALDLVSRGYSVIPIHRQQKKSAVKWKEFQTRRASHEEVTKWFEDTDYNIAIVAGEISGCVVVDADSESAVRYCKLMLTPTPMQVKTRKGIHFFYRHPGRLVQSKARVIDDPPIDIRADKGIAVTVGSIHETGFEYHLVEGCDLFTARDLPIYDPTWFPIQSPPKPSLARLPVSGDAMTRASRYMDRVEGVGSGQRNDKAFKLAAVLTHDFGLEQEQAETLLSIWNTRNLPPLPEHELKTTISSSVRSGQNPFGSKL